MSQLKHPTVSAWQRDENGNYEAEINGYRLKVWWAPAQGHDPRGFRWEATGADGYRLFARHSHEEMEVAMAEAETVVDPAHHQDDGVIDRA